MRYSEKSAVEKLQRNGVRIEEKTYDNYVIHVNSHSIGIKLWGAIDFLRKIHNYRIVKEN